MKEISIDELKSLQLKILNAVDEFCVKNKINYSLAYGTLLGAVRHKGYIPWDDDIDILMPRKDYEKFLATFKSERYRAISFPTEPNFVIPYAKVIDTNTLLIEHSTMKFPIGVNIDVFPVDICPSSREESLWFKKKQFLNNIYTLRKLRIDSERSFLKNSIIVVARILTFPFSLKFLCRHIQKMAQMYQNSDNKRMAVLATSDTKLNWMMPSIVFSKFKRIQFENGSYQSVYDTDTYLSSTYGDYMKLPPEDQRIPHHEFVAYWK